MKSKEQAHHETVRWHIDGITDADSGQDITELARRYETVRYHLLAAITGLRHLDSMNIDDYSGYGELRTDLDGIVAALRSDEIALLELVSNMTDTPETAQV